MLFTFLLTHALVSKVMYFFCSKQLLSIDRQMLTFSEMVLFVSFYLTPMVTIARRLLAPWHKLIHLSVMIFSIPACSGCLLFNISSFIFNEMFTPFKTIYGRAALNIILLTAIIDHCSFPYSNTLIAVGCWLVSLPVSL